ncbi:MAG: hypothetical protein V4615_01670, partial [Bacteroidota bacterium]
RREGNANPNAETDIPLTALVLSSYGGGGSRLCARRRRMVLLSLREPCGFLSSSNSFLFLLSRSDFPA